MSSPGLARPIRSFFAHRAARILSRRTIQHRQWTRSLTTYPPSKDEPIIPLRKQLKDSAKQKKKDARDGTSPPPPPEDASAVADWELTVGIEIHAELNTARKLFSSAPTSTSSATPNSNVALFDLAFPGTQPHFQPATLLPALRAALALNCNIQRTSSFDRKHYFYADQPQGYQITQYYSPFARDGSITLYAHDGIAAEDGEMVEIGIKQVQMEQDTAKTILNPPGNEQLLDFNRVSHPLIEIITLPQIHHPATAAALVRKVQGILKAVDACTTGMELGGLRADVNVSVKRRNGGAGSNAYAGITGLGQRTEIKNLSSFKAVEDAIIAERNRQIRVLEGGGVIAGETRGWTLGSTETRKLRGKEGEVDYRYMPDPDIAPVIISPGLVEHLRSRLPQLPDETLQMLTEGPEHGLTMKDAKTLLSFDDGDRLDFYFEVLHLLKQSLAAEGEVPSQLGRVVGNWVIHEIGALLGRADTPWHASPLTVTHLDSLLSLLLRGKISNASAKQLLSRVFEGDERSINDIAVQEGLLIQEIDQDAYVAAARALVDENPEMVKMIKEKGQRGKVMWFVGQMMRKMGEQFGRGGVNAEKAKAAVLKVLDLPA